MKLPTKVVTKKDKKKFKKRKIATGLLIFVLIVAVLILSFLIVFKKDPLYLNPLSGNQISERSEIEKMLKIKKTPYVSISTSNDLNYIVNLDGESEVIIDSTKDIEQQLSSLQLIASQLTIEGKKFKSIDFRYKNPIIKFYDE